MFNSGFIQKIKHLFLSAFTGTSMFEDETPEEYAARRYPEPTPKPFLIAHTAGTGCEMIFMKKPI